MDTTRHRPSRLPDALRDDGWWLAPPPRGPAVVIPFPQRPPPAPAADTVVLFPAHLLPPRRAPGR